MSSGGQDLSPTNTVVVPLHFSDSIRFPIKVFKELTTTMPSVLIDHTFSRLNTDGWQKLI